MKNHYTKNLDHYIENGYHYRPFQTGMKWFLSRGGKGLSQTITTKRGCIKEGNIFSGTNVPPFARPVLTTPPAVLAGSREGAALVLLTGQPRALKGGHSSPAERNPPSRIISFISSGAGTPADINEIMRSVRQARHMAGNKQWA